MLPLLDATDHQILGAMDDYYGRGPSHVCSETGIAESLVRKRLCALLQHGVVEFGPLFDEDDGLTQGRGYWISPFGKLVRAAAAAEPHGEMADMFETISRTTASGVPITRTPRVEDTAEYARPIGLSGFASTGKTEAARFIEAEFGYVRQHIAEPLRRMLASLLRDCNPSYTDQDIERWLTGEWKDGVIVPELGVTSRHLQITLGTEWGRQHVGSDIWAKLWRTEAEVGRACDGKGRMNDSVRFPNEEQAVRTMRGVTILITRPGTGPAAFKWKRLGPVLYHWFGCMWGVHDSERIDRLKPDYVIVNDDTIGELHGKIEQVLRNAQAALAHEDGCA
ncbi:MAG: hypothetical protein ABIS14_12855 [Sphingomonas sp.]